MAVRAEIARRARAGDSFRQIALWATNEGQPIGRDSLARHVRVCVGIDDTAEAESPKVGATLVALAVADVFARWPTAANEAAQALASSGLHEAAAVLQSTIPEMMQKALVSVADTPAVALLEARCLARACREALPAHPAACRAVAAHLALDGADELADALLGLAGRPSSLPLPPAAEVVV